jgi:hypothetical protein
MIRTQGAGVLGVLVIVWLMVFPYASPAVSSPAETSTTPKGWLQISVNLDHKVIKAGDRIEYNTLVTNTGTEPSPPVIVAMNIVNLEGTKDPVDPEDWSPQRTQYVDMLTPGQTVKLSWRVNAIFDGDYMVYMVAVPEPEDAEATSHPVASSGIHLTVQPFTSLNPLGILPYAVGGPMVLLVGILLLNRARHRGVDTGDSQVAVR